MEGNLQNLDCPCPKIECLRHTHCNDCRSYHLQDYKLPFCDRQNKELLNQLKIQRKKAKLEARIQKKSLR